LAYHANRTGFLVLAGVFLAVVFPQFSIVVKVDAAGHTLVLVGKHVTLQLVLHAI
jgi:hypothetical protein